MVASRALSWLRAHAIHLTLFAIGLVGYGAVAGDRLGRPSAANHFVRQAAAWLDGDLAIRGPVERGNDWAKVETVVLDDGAVVRGRRMTSRAHRGRFQLVGGGTIPVERIARSQGTTHYMSFPPLPAVLMLPQVAIAGERAGDVAFSVVFAAAVLPLLFATLRRLRRAGHSARSVAEDLWLVALFAFGSVWFFAAVQGSVWYTAHVVGVFFAVAYAWAAIDARAPVLAGLALALATMSRTPLAFMVPLFVLEAWRVSGGLADRRALAWRLLAFAAPVVIVAIAAAAYNQVRFASPLEFGHSFLDVRQQAQIEQHGLFSYQYLARNLAVAFTLLPELPGRAPWLQISGHGLAIWVTTPALLLLVWPRTRPPLHRALWLTVGLVAVPTFFYQNSGWVQFGYRFALDYLPFLVLLLAIGGRRLGVPARGLIVLGIAINLFGALTFDRAGWRYYRLGPSRAADTSAYEVIVAH
jgi:hypothetical protein